MKVIIGGLEEANGAAVQIPDRGSVPHIWDRGDLFGPCHSDKSACVFERGRSSKPDPTPS
jgi:hypothetical protein